VANEVVRSELILELFNLEKLHSTFVSVGKLSILANSSFQGPISVDSVRKIEPFIVLSEITRSAACMANGGISKISERGRYAT
jgi:hypothetical protein